MNKKITSALLSVFDKQGLEPLVRELSAQGVRLFSTGGTLQFIQTLGLPSEAVETLTLYPSILGGRVKTLHPKVFGGILGRRSVAQDLEEMHQYEIPEIDLVVVDLYPFEATLTEVRDPSFSGSPEEAHKKIIEKIDIGGPSMIRAAAKNFQDVVVISSKGQYEPLVQLLRAQEGSTRMDQRRELAAAAFEIVAHYDLAIRNYFFPEKPWNLLQSGPEQSLRYGENPHQKARFWGDWNAVFSQLHGKELSYNNLVDADAAIQLIDDFQQWGSREDFGSLALFGIIKHTNVCGVAARPRLEDAWKAALAGDPESAFGGVLVTNRPVDAATAQAIQEIFFEVLVAPAYESEALEILRAKKNRILLQLVAGRPQTSNQFKSVLNGTLEQGRDAGNTEKWEETGGRPMDPREIRDARFANLVCKHLKSNAIALVHDLQLIGKGCGQTSRVDALRQSLEKARQFGFSLQQAVLASDAFFPFDDCVRMAHQAGIQAFIQPGGSIRDKDSIAYCQQNGLAMVITGMRHFKH